MLKSLDENIYSRAKAVAMGNGRKFHLSAIIWRNKKPIGIYTNSDKSHPSCARVFRSGNENNTLHAEMSAVRFAKPGDKIEVLRWDKSGNLTCSKPCPMCHRAMQRAGVKVVTYVDWDGSRQKMKLDSATVAEKVKYPWAS